MFVELYLIYLRTDETAVMSVCLKKREVMSEFFNALAETFWPVSRTKLVTAILSLTSISIFLNSSVVFLVIFCSRKLNRRPSSLLLLGLTLSDVMFLLYVLFNLAILHRDKLAGQVCDIFNMVISSQTCIGFAHLCLLGCDRYTAVIYPLR